MAAMAAKRRPCCHCLSWFTPDAGVGVRQRTCSREECQEARRAATQSSWRARQLEYDRARRTLAIHTYGHLDDGDVREGVAKAFGPG